MENNDEARAVAEHASTSKEKPLEATAGDDYGCEHYKRKAKFVVSLWSIVSLSASFHVYSVMFARTVTWLIKICLLASVK